MCSGYRRAKPDTFTVLHYFNSPSIPLRLAFSRRSVRGGDFLDLQLKEVIEKKTGKPLAVRPERLPSGKYKSPTNAHLSSLSASEKAYRDFCVHASMTDFKKSHGVSLQFAKVDMREVSGLIPDGSVYELPDGTPVNVNEHPDLYVVPEAMFMEVSRSQ